MQASRSVGKMPAALSHSTQTEITITGTTKVTELIVRR